MEKREKGTNISLTPYSSVYRTQGRLEARRAHGTGMGAGPFAPSAQEAGVSTGAAAALMTHAWAMEGTGPLMAPAEHPAPGEGLQLEVGGWLGGWVFLAGSCAS